MPADEVTPERIRAALNKATEALLAERNERGFWEGDLSSSALSTATAATALAVAQKHCAAFPLAIYNPQSAIDNGLTWLAQNQNADGGWGDTIKSLSNISTTTLCWAAFGVVTGIEEKFVVTVNRAEQWLRKQAGGIAPDQLAPAIIARYGKDRTFSVPILTMCTLAGRLGSGTEAWRHVIPLPFELAACPHQLFAALRLPVVSYALPALIAIGQARHIHAPTRNPVTRLIRNATRQKTLRVLTDIQPSNGGFLEATPLTSFVTMSLAASGQVNHPVTQRGLEFLRKSQRADGSWPIDTNLSSWCTTLAIDALDESAIQNPQSTIDWLLNQQYKIEHPYTHAAPGGWAWTDLPGGVPDADDTAGALLALAKLRSADYAAPNEEINCAAELGIRWLIRVQNRDGGIPTFCRGWGALPFDRSTPDITAHAIRAWIEWEPYMTPAIQRRTVRALKKAVSFLEQTQCTDGAFVPLWFGNQFAPNEENKVYGTARVALALACVERQQNERLGRVKTTCELVSLRRAGYWLIRAQHANGSWGGDAIHTGSFEETALSLHALSSVLECNYQMPEQLGSATRRAIRLGAEWLLERIESGQWREPSPIGFYFAKLWYFERLYPLIFTAAALRAVLEALES